MNIILGSKSFGRKKVLEAAGYKFSVMVADINEKAIRNVNFSILPLLIAREKTRDLLPKVPKDSILITSDQIVVFKEQLREKPESIDQAREYLISYSNNQARTITSVVVTNTTNGKVAEGIDTVDILFKKIPSIAIDELIREKKVLQTAGACIAEDPLLSPYIKELKGDLDSVTGLPMKLTERLMREVGYV